MFACIYFVEDNSLTVVGQKSKRLQHLGEFKERENVKMTWGKDLFLGTIVKIHESEDYLTEFPTKANAQILKKLKERPSEVPRELFTFDHISKTDGKRQHKETNKIKESRQQEKDFSPKKKSNLVSMQPKGKITEKQNSIDSTNPTIVNSQKRKVQEKSNLSTCNLLMSDIANQFENDSSVHYNEPSAKLTPDQCAESTGNFPLPSPVLQNLCSQLQLSASASTAREDEPPIYTPLTATWSLCTSTDRPDDSPGNLFSHPAPPPAILDLFEALCQPHIQNYLLQFVQHFRNPRPNASSFYQNETNYSENGTECTTQASLQSVQESGNGCQQPIQSSFYVANNCTSSQDLFVPSVQLECNPNPVNRQEPHSFPHSPASPRAASSPRRSPRKPKYQGDVSGVAQERDDDTVKLLASSDIVVKRSELRKATSAAAKAAPKKAAFTLASKLLPRLFSWQELAMSRGQGLRKKKAGDIRPPLHHDRIEVLKDYVIAWCTKNGKEVKEQDINDAITEQVSYARKKLKSQ